MMNTSGSNVIGHDDLVSALHMLGIWCYKENDFSLFICPWVYSHLDISGIYQYHSG